MKILLTGDSHLAALHHGLKALQAEGRAPAGVSFDLRPLGSAEHSTRPFFEAQPDHLRLTHPAYASRLPRIPPDPGGPYDAIGLSLPLWSLRPVRALVVAGLAPSPAAPLRPISANAFAASVRGDMQHVLALAEALVARGYRTCAVAPPRLFADHPILRRAPVPLVLSMLDRAQAILLDELARRGVDAVLPPAQCFDDLGLVRPAYRLSDAGDPHHANAAFGALMIHEIAAWATTPARAPTA